MSWIRNYDTDMIIGDIIAGITLGLTMIPQAIAYAGLAGLPSQYGLYSAFMGMKKKNLSKNENVKLIGNLFKVRLFMLFLAPLKRFQWALLPS